MRVAWFAWKDIRHPEAGGAELVAHDWLRRLRAEGHDVVLVTAGYPGASAEDVIDDIRIRRLGNRYSHYPLAVAHYVRELRTEIDLIVEEVNTIPYLLSAVAGKVPVLLFYPQLAREIWFYQMPFPASVVGYLAEPVYTWLQSRFAKPVVTISDDSRSDLLRFGFSTDSISVVPLGTNAPVLERYEPNRKEKLFTVLFHGSLRAMKRPQEVLKAFALFRKRGGEGQLWVSGGGDSSELEAFASREGFASDVTFFGRTSEEQKLELMQRATVLTATSVKEGWGLIVTEANRLATPAVVYDVDGLRHAARGEGNRVVAADASSLADALLEASTEFRTLRTAYDTRCSNVLEEGRGYTFERSYAGFRQLVQEVAVHV